MAKPNGRRTPTLSISLTPELMAAVDARVESGLYTSASELVREALRLFVQVENARQSVLQESPSRDALGERLASTFELFDFGAAVQAQKLRRAMPGISDGEVEQRRLASSAAVETDAVIRPSPERLARLEKAARGPK
jgi:antitoxin ParD1/3/4